MRERLWRWLLVIVWMGVIFRGSASSDPYLALPSGWTGRCAQILPGESLDVLICQNDSLGDLSHILEYLVLGFLLARALDPPAPAPYPTGSVTKPFGSSLPLSDRFSVSVNSVICVAESFFASHAFAIPFLAFSATVLFALSDEVHQIFIPGRAFQIADLVRDALGAALGVMAYRMIQTARARQGEYSRG
jgi:VanZ family protein